MGTRIGDSPAARARLGCIGLVRSLVSLGDRSVSLLLQKPLVNMRAVIDIQNKVIAALEAVKPRVAAAGADSLRCGCPILKCR